MSGMSFGAKLLIFLFLDRDPIVFVGKLRNAYQSTRSE